MVAMQGRQGQHTEQSNTICDQWLNMRKVLMLARRLWKGDMGKLKREQSDGLVPLETDN